jgi:hypothetical protein
MAPGSTGSSASADDILIRVGNNTVTIAQGSLTGPDTTIEQQYVGEAVSKLGTAIIAAKPKKNKRLGNLELVAGGGPIEPPHLRRMEPGTDREPVGLWAPTGSRERHPLPGHAHGPRPTCRVMAVAVFWR